MALARGTRTVPGLKDLRRIGNVARLTGVFTATMLAPIAFLAFLALSSVRSDTALDADLQNRARAVSEQLRDELDDKFRRFEEAVKERLGRGESPTANLGELSPYLQAAFRFDDDGRLAAPFELAETPLPPSPPLGWQRAARVALALEDTDPRAAAVAWHAARFLTDRPSAVGESMLGEARSDYAAGSRKEAEDLLSEVWFDHGTDLDQRGFRFYDLATLELAHLRLGKGADGAADGILYDLVDRVLTRTWTIGRDGDPAVAREALKLLGGRMDPDWTARSTSRLNELQEQLNWAERVQDEIELVYSRVPEGKFQYIGARFDSDAVWALTRAGDSTYAFSFSGPSLFDDLQTSVTKANDLDRDLSVHLYVGEEPPESAILVQGLGQVLPVATLAVAPKDPVGLHTAQRRQMGFRIAIVFTAVFISVMGALWIVRFVQWEVETARQRADFAANVSHELRSPITQIRLKGEALQLGLVEPGDDMQQYFDAIVRESERLSRLVDNVLDFAAIERGAKRYSLRPDDLGDVVSVGVETARSSLESAGMVVDVDLSDDLPLLALDREAMGQVMTNLLSNALKYGAEGRWVGVGLHPADLDGSGVARTVELSVADRGMGIGENELPHVFDDFFRSSDPRVRRTKGTGIGLAIVRYIVEAHGGTIRVDSTPGRGARFVVQMPVQSPDAEGQVDGSRTEPSGSGERS